MQGIQAHSYVESLESLAEAYALWKHRMGIYPLNYIAYRRAIGLLDFW